MLYQQLISSQKNIYTSKSKTFTRTYLILTAESDVGLDTIKVY